MPVYRKRKSAGYSPAPFRSCDVLWYYPSAGCGSLTLANSAETSAVGLRLRVLGSTSLAEMTIAPFCGL